ncbi:MAG: amidohydrolase [Chloroflexi bacterium]|nr:amidohydrolase [Chloroflexota bacterium]
MTTLYAEKQAAFDWIEANRARLSGFCEQIWNYAETAFREYKSARAYCDLLRAEGFTVEEGSAEMPTAFVATYGNGGPVLATFSEYDAVPENSQERVPYPSPRAGLNRWAAGHTDPHSSLGTSALIGALAAKAMMVKYGLHGTLKLFGEPAEKVCGSKPVHAAKGYYDGLDAAVVYHPNASNSVVWETHSGSYWSAAFVFECIDPEEWIDQRLLPNTSTSHAAARCPAAIDALCLMYTLTKYSKEAMFPHTGTWTLNENIMVGGQCTSDNLPPRLAVIQYSWRSPTLDIQERVFQVLAQNARQVAGATGCVASVRWITKTRVGLPNLAISDLAYRNLELVGAPQFGDEARTFARAIQKNLGFEPMDDPFIADNQTLTPPPELEARVRQGLPPWQLNFTSDDYVEYTWHAPTVRLYTARPRLKAPKPGYTYPAWVNNAMGGVPACIDPGMFVAGKTIAATMLDLLKSPDELAKAQAEFRERTGGGVGGSQWVAPLLARDFPPPVELRWPEYVQTPRGEEWWVPTVTHESAYVKL